MLHIDPALYIFAALLIITVPLPWLCAAIVAASIHELAHISAILLLGGNISRISISLGGAKIHTYLLTPAKEFVCALAGPAGSFLLLCTRNRFPALAFCALVQGLFNLIPVYPLDGGRALHCLFLMLFPEKALFLTLIICNIVTMLLLFLSVWGCFFLSLGPVPIIITFLLLHNRKKTCK